MHNNQKKPEFYVQFIKQTGPQRFNLTIVHNRNLTVKITQQKHYISPSKIYWSDIICVSINAPKCFIFAAK